MNSSDNWPSDKMGENTMNAAQLEQAAYEASRVSAANAQVLAGRAGPARQRAGTADQGGLPTHVAATSSRCQPEPR